MKLGPYELDRIYTGDARELAGAIPDGSVDLIFTDPPYGREYLHLYEWLGRESARVLKPDGFLLVYMGVYWKDEVMARMRPHLAYFSDLVMLNPGGATMAWSRRLILRHKYVTAYRPLGGRGLPCTNVLSVWNGDRKDKRYHEWGQSESGPSYLIDCFSESGAVVADFFLGGGTTAAVCQQLRRRWIGFDVDPEAVTTVRNRLSGIVPGPVQLSLTVEP